MFIIFGMIVFLLFKNFLFAWLAIFFYLFIFFKNKTLVESSSLIILCLLLSLSHNYSPSKEIYKGKVEKLHNYGFTLRGFVYRIYISGEYELGLGDKVSLKGTVLKEGSPTFNRHIGKIENAKIIKHNEVKNLRKTIFEKHPEHFEMLFDASNDHIINSLGLQLMGVFAIYCLLYQRFFGILKYEKTFLFFLSFLFGRSFVWWRLVLKSFNVSTDHQIIILLLFFPNAIFSPSFIYAYSLYLLSKFTDEFRELNSSLLFGQLSLFFFHEWNVLMLFVYPALKYLAGLYALLILLACFISPFNFLLIGSQKLGNLLVNTSIYQRFQIRGTLHFLSFFMLMIVKNKQDHILLFLMIIILVVYPPFARITYIDVGQGDSTLVSLPFNTNHYLIDTGRTYAYSNVKKVLKQHGVGTLDYLVLTHDDADHVENKNELMKDFTPRYLVEEKGHSIEFMQSHLQDYDFGEGNEDSIILTLNLHGLDYLFLGDAHKKQEEILVRDNPNFNVDILKLGHHGSNTSTSEDLLKVSEANIAIISSKPSVYNHPRPEVMRSLFNHDILPIETSKEGNITIHSSPLLQYIKTSKGSFAIIDKGD